MAQLIDKLQTVLRADFPGASAELEIVPPAKKIGGFLIWAGFEGIEQIDRQRQLARVLRKRLSSEDASRVTTILTLTPAESAVMKESASAE